VTAEPKQAVLMTGYLDQGSSRTVHLTSGQNKAQAITKATIHNHNLNAQAIMHNQDHAASIHPVPLTEVTLVAARVSAAINPGTVAALKFKQVKAAVNQKRKQVTMQQPYEKKRRPRRNKKQLLL
jgi:hypothetical protein